MSLVIQCATPAEFQALQTVFETTETQQVGKRIYFSPRPDLIILRGGLGKVHAAASTEFAIANWQPELLIDFGAAGALISELRVGDIVVADKVIEHDVPVFRGRLPVAACARDARLGDWFEKVTELPEFVDLQHDMRATRASLAAGDRNVESAGERVTMAQALQVAAVSWESSAIGRVCQFHQVPFVSIRFITDCGEGELISDYKKGLEQFLVPAAKNLALVLPDRR